MKTWQNKPLEDQPSSQTTQDTTKTINSTIMKSYTSALGNAIMKSYTIAKVVPQRSWH